ncbi:uncharacterized protein LOC143188102 [Calliopsis andreniformis]|uniref:uncharacterized protein LOC143188102 n=1 Tax=Calliopsis andreniformis TaxID=337506 RepID=UPI003FCE58FD
MVHDDQWSSCPLVKGVQDDQWSRKSKMTSDQTWSSSPLAKGVQGPGVLPVDPLEDPHPLEDPRRVRLLCSCSGIYTPLEKVGNQRKKFFGCVSPDLSSSPRIA